MNDKSKTIPEQDAELEAGALDAMESALEAGGTKAADEEGAPPPDEDAVAREPESEIDDETPKDDSDGDPDDQPAGEADDPSEAAASPSADDGDASPADQSEDEDSETEEPGEGEEPTGEEKPSDKFGDLPEGTKAETKDRFNRLKSGYDEVMEELESTRGRFDQWMETIKETGTSPDQLASTFEYLRNVNSGTTEGLQAARQIMLNELEALSKMLGEPIPGQDILDEYPDLKGKVESLDLSREDAEELARARAQRAARERLAESEKNKTNQQRGSEQENERALQELSRLGTEWRKNDPQYAQKHPALERALKELIDSGAPPSTWAPTVKAVYAGLGSIRSEQPKAKPKGKQGQPMRPGPPGKTGSMSKEPGNIEEAIDHALGL